MTTYVRIRFRPEGGSPRTIILVDPHESTSEALGPIITGIEVDREGDEIAGRGFDERRHVISTALITKRTPLVMDRYTGLLTEPDDQMREGH